MGFKEVLNEYASIFEKQGSDGKEKAARKVSSGAEEG